MQQQWVAFSLTVWGVFITVLTALLPALNAWLNLGWSVETIEQLDESVKAAITAIGVAVGIVLVMVDRVFGDTNKKLVFNPAKDTKLKSIFK